MCEFMSTLCKLQNANVSFPASTVKKNMPTLYCLLLLLEKIFGNRNKENSLSHMCNTKKLLTVFS